MLALPPWNDKNSWQQINQYFAYTLKNGHDFKDVLTLAENIESKIVQIDETLQLLCQRSCSRCLDVCCLKATVWYDFRDLLFQFVRRGNLPVKQISRADNRACMKLSKDGCELKRTDRPFICTWYVCSQQTALLESHYSDNNSVDVVGALKDIQSERKQMEQRFLESIT